MERYKVDEEKLKEFNDSQVLTVTNLVKFYRVEKSTSYLD